VSATAGKALDALEAIGNELQLYRGYGHLNPRTNQHEVNGKTARQDFWADHKNVQTAIQQLRLERLPKRAVFGLPHNYFFSSIKQGDDNSLDLTAQNPESAGQETDGRRASPLLVHIHPLKDGQFIAIQTLLPEVFLPQGVGLSAKVGVPKRKTRPVPAPRETTVDYTFITRYLDGFANKNTLKAPHHG
jgi:CRISPR-associated protein Cmr1